MSIAEAGRPALVPDLYRRPQGPSASLRIGRRHRIGGLLRSIGPELVSGASDNDPTNVGAATAVGAATGFQLAWVALLVSPLL